MTLRFLAMAALLAAAPDFALAAAPPTAIVPHVAVTSTDVPLEFSAAKYNVIALDGDDLDVAGGDTVTISVDHGTLTLVGDSSSGLTYTDGDGIDDSSITLAGTLAEINDELDGMTYTPPSGFSGRPTLTIAANNVASSTKSSSTILVATIRIAVNAIMDTVAARNTIGAGVNEIHSGDFPGRLVCYGEEAANIIMYSSEDEREGPMIGAANWGSGRVVAMPDHHMLLMGSYGDVSGTFYRNVISWLAKSTAMPDMTSVSILLYDKASADWLTSDGYTNVFTTDEANLVSDLDIVNPDVFVGGWMGSSEPEENLNALEDFVAVKGKGLFISDYGVGYLWFWDKSYHQAPGNLLLREAGIGFGSGYKWHEGNIDATNGATGNQVTAETTLQMLTDTSGYTLDELEHGGYILAMLFDILHEDDPLFLRLDEVSLRKIESIYPTPDDPVSDEFGKGLLKRESQLLDSTPVDDVVPHRTLKDVYGAVPIDAPRISARTVSIDLSRTRWAATGMYIPAGEVVTVTVPSDLVGRGYQLRINAHTDDISPRRSWYRPPKVHRYFTINAEITRIASAFGGALFVDLLGDGWSTPHAASGTADVTIEGAVEHPYFVLGEHTDDDWNMEGGLKTKQTPYAVFVSQNFIFVQRSTEHSTLTRPTELMEYWNGMVIMQDDLASRANLRTGAELVNVDIQNDAGDAHAGYPIQAYDKHWGNLADLTDLKTMGSWGNYHEVGHNMQREWWTSEGHEEVTVNIFSAYCLRNIVDSPHGEWSWSADELTTMDKSVSVTAENFHEYWLTFWMNQAYWFGFDQMRDTFGTYEDDSDNNPGALPTTTQEEWDQWIVRFSTQVGHDITGYARDTYGLGVSDAAAQQVADLRYPAWMPAYPGIYGSFGSSPSEPLTLDLGGEAKVLDGIVTIDITSPALHGTVDDNGDGTWTYTPHAGLGAGVFDNFSYAAISSTGHSRETTLNIEIYSPKPTVPYEHVDLSHYAEYVSEEVNYNEGLTDLEVYFVADDPNVGPTDPHWIGDMRETVYVPLQSSCLNEGETVTAQLDARQQACGWRWQMNGYRRHQWMQKHACSHSLVLKLDPVAQNVNEWLHDPMYGGCVFRTAENAPVKFIVKSFYTKRELGDLLLKFTVTTMPAHS